LTEEGVKNGERRKRKEGDEGGRDRGAGMAIGGKIGR